MSDVLQANREEFLSVCSPTMRDALEHLIDQTNDITIRYKGFICRMGEVLEDSASSEVQSELNLIVHKDWPLEQAGGRAQLFLRVANHLSKQQSVFSLRVFKILQMAEHIIDEWLKTYTEKMSCLLADPQSFLITNSSARDTYASPEHTYSFHNRGYLPPEYLAKFLEKTGGISPKRPVRIHGATHGCCPAQSGFQVAIASHLGVYLPISDCYGEYSSYAENNLAMAFNNTGALQNSPVNFGVVMDCIGVREDPSRLGSMDNFALMISMIDNKTLILPDDDRRSRSIAGMQ